MDVPKKRFYVVVSVVQQIGFDDEPGGKKVRTLCSQVVTAPSGDRLHIMKLRDKIVHAVDLMDTWFSIRRQS